ncbi:MAG: hypothetical protein PHC62_01065 [Candidatus Izemoplasmatales bacterium]|nr:hypothetical protein [Candidatus Izemoplasmatales bacterium]
MAKGPQRGNNRKKGPNYFELNIRNIGEDFINRKNPFDIQRDAKKVFMDLEHGNVDIERDAKYFANVFFIQNLLQVANDNYYYHAYTMNGMKQIINDSGAAQIDAAFIKVMERHEYTMKAYGVVVKYLNNMLNNMGVRVNLSELMRTLQSFRGAFSDMFIVRDDYTRRQERRNYNNDQGTGN